MFTGHRSFFAQDYASVNAASVRFVWSYCCDFLLNEAREKRFKSLKKMKTFFGKKWQKKQLLEKNVFMSSHFRHHDRWRNDTRQNVIQNNGIKEWH